MGLIWLRDLAGMLMPGPPIYVLLYGVLIVFFCFFYTALQYNPGDGGQPEEVGRVRAGDPAATNTGITAAIGRDGRRVLARLPQFTEGRLETAAQGYSGATPYVCYKDWPIVGLSLTVIAAAAIVFGCAHRPNRAR